MVFILAYKRIVGKKKKREGGFERLFSLSTLCPLATLFLCLSVRLCFCHLLRSLLFNSENESEDLFFCIIYDMTYDSVIINTTSHICLESTHFFFFTKDSAQRLLHFLL